MKNTDERSIDEMDQGSGDSSFFSEAMKIL